MEKTVLSLPVALARLGAVSFFCADDHVYVGCSLLGLADEIDVPGGDSFWFRDFAEGGESYIAYRLGA